MSCSISRSLSKICKDSRGGISKVYLFPYVKYNRSSIKVTNLVLNEFPTTQIFEFSAVLNSNLDQKMTDEDGGKYYTQSISLQFQGIKDKFTFEKLLKKDYRLIIEDNNGNLRLLGAYNGLECESLDVDTGSSKNSFNGLTVNFSGKERNEALFIEDLEAAGFIVNNNEFNPNAYVIRVKTDNAGTSLDNQFYLPTYLGGDFNYDIKTSDGHNITGITSDYTITFSSAGEYIVEITGTYSAHRNNNQNDKLKLLEIIQFGNPTWNVAHFTASYYGCANLINIPTDLDTGIFFNSLTSSSASSLFRNSGVKRLPLNTSFPYITNFYWFCDGATLDTDVCSALIINIEANNPYDNKVIHFGNSKYNISAVPSLNSLIARGWTVQSAGLE